MDRLPLAGVRVADFTQIQAGGHSAQWLAVLGAEVIKIESRRRPELLRQMAPDLNKSSAFNALNYGKKDCSINLTKPRGVELAKGIIGISDVVMENYATGVMDRLGLGYPELRRIRPDIIMVSISGPGRMGPEKDYLAFAPTVHAYSGMCSLTGYPGGPPNMMGAMWVDALTAQTGAFAALAALHHRSLTGEGQHIDISMIEVMLSLLPEAVTDYSMNQRVRGRMGNRDDIMAPHGCYRCKGKDKWVAIAVSSDEEWRSLCHAIGREEWLEDERFSDCFSRWRNQDELDRLIEGWTINHTHYEVMGILQRVGVAAGPSVSVDELVDDPHLNERDFFVEIDHKEMGKGRYARLPLRLGGSPVGNYSSPPLLGEHNSYVFGELLGMSQDEIKRLIEEEVIY